VSLKYDEINFIRAFSNIMLSSTNYIQL